MPSLPQSRLKWVREQLTGDEMGQRPTTSLKILDSMKDKAPISVAEVIKKTSLRLRQVDAILHSMLKRGLVLHPHRGRWQISLEGTRYLKKWIQKAAAQREIIQKYISGKTLEEIAEEYSTSSEAARRLLLQRCPKVIRSRGIKKKDPRACTAILSFEQEQEIVKLYDEGKSARQIGKALRISNCTVLKVLHYHALDRVRLPIHPAAKIKPQPTKLTPEKASLIGHFIGDGSVMKRGYAIRYTNTCQKLIEKVSKLFTNVYGLNGHISQRGEMLYVDWGSKEAWVDLRKYTIYDCRKWKVPTEILRNPEILGPPFLRALFDDDGCVALCSSSAHMGWQRWICLRSINSSGCKDIAYLLSLLGIYARKADGAVIISGKENIERFKLMIGFTNGVKVRRGLWKGIDKAEVLKLLLASYRDLSIPHQKLANLTNFNSASSLCAPLVSQITS